MNNTSELERALAQCYGTEEYFFNPLYSWLKYSDGAQCFALNAGNGAYWFLDIVGTELKSLSKQQSFICIKMTVTNTSAQIIADDGNDNLLWSKDINYTDCPEGTWKFYLVDSVLMLPSEY